LADRRAQGFRVKGWRRGLAWFGVIAAVALAYFFGRGGRDDSDTDTAGVTALDPGYAARDAEVIETGYDGRERYRLKAAVIRQQTESGLIDLEQLEMNYHRNTQAAAGEAPGADKDPGEVWHLTSDHGQVREEGNDVELHGNVRLTGPPQGGVEPLTLTTESLRINTPTEFIETDAAVKLRWSGHELDAIGMRADLKAGTLRLESDVNGHFQQK
jgi:LPS export ABC transporter protein LptC